MTRVHPRPHGAKNPTDLSAAPERRPFIRWDDPAEVKRWLVTLRSAAADAIAAGEDATRRADDRVLSRAEARRKLLAADERIARLVDLVERGLERTPTS